MSHFQKRHYEALAQLMQDQCPSLPKIPKINNPGWDYDETGHEYGALGRQEMWDDMVEDLAQMLQSDNRLFDRSRFIHACQPGSNVRARTAHLKAVS